MCLSVKLSNKNNMFSPPNFDKNKQSLKTKEAKKEFKQVCQSQKQATEKQRNNNATNAKENFNLGGLGPNFNNRWEQKSNNKKKNDREN